AGTSGSTSARQKVTIALVNQPQSTLIFVAMKKGYFSDEGLDVQALPQSNGKLALQSMVQGKADFATVAETPVMFSILRDERIFVIANIETSTANDAVIARVDAGIAKPADLKGKRIGFMPGTTIDFFLDSFLIAQGLTRLDITPIPLKPDEMLDVLLTKKADAVAAWNYPLTQIKRRLGAQAVTFYDRQIYTEHFNIAAMQEFVRQNPQTVTALLRGLVRAEDFVTSHANEAQDIVSDAIKVDRDLVKEVWDVMIYRVRLDQNLPITLEDETRWAMKNKLTDQAVMPNYLSYIYVDGLKAVKPGAVRMDR
ncbi:MAG: NrtA/SsuA/CpmA family ABC transporter substrate-binding protein, partial [Nitrosomonadales bacterium]